MKDETMPNGKWEFDESVTNVFDDMLSRSIPQYELMRKSVEDLIIKSLDGKQNFNLLDIGCSNGLMLENLVKLLKDKNGRYLGCDVSEPMLHDAKVRLLDYIIEGSVNIEYIDLRHEFPDGMFNAVTSILTMQFIPIEYRQQIIQSIYNSMYSGTFIMVEKVLGNTHKLNSMMVDEYYDMKRDNGYTQEQIDRKRLSLEGVLVPVTSDWNIELLKQAGFKQVDVFWRWMNFVGYIAIK